MSAEYKLLLEPVESSTANSDVKSTLESAKMNLGFIPNMYANMANAPSLLKSYLQTYDLFRIETDFNAIEQEVIFLAISRENDCEYCVAAHSVIADNMSGVPVEITDAIRNDGVVNDSKLAALIEFTNVMQRSRGLPTKNDANKFLSVGYTEKHILEVIVAIAVKTMSNYSNHLFHTTVDNAFSGRLWEMK
jgi:uncharacterized peroxidase-related enzyme